MKSSMLLWLGASMSLALNAYWFTNPVHDSATTSRARDCPTVSAPRQLIGGCERHLGECLHLRSECTAQINTCEEESSAPPDLRERFETGHPNAELVGRVEIPVADLRAAFPQSRLELACRDDVCRLLIEPEPETSIDVLMGPIQGGLADLITAAQFDVEQTDEAGNPTSMSMLMAIREAEQADGMRVLIEIERQFLDDGPLESCHAAHGQAGTFDVALDLVADEQVVVHVGGSLGTTATGRCLLTALENAIATADIPARHTGARRYLVLDVPAAD